jgi:hypothetical protein
MKQALETLERLDIWLGLRYGNERTPSEKEVIRTLRQAIAEAEKQPVHASDISQERVDETAKRKHEWVGLDGDIPGLGLVTEEFYNGMLCAEDILRKKNT